MFMITVRDTFCGVKGRFAEEQTCTTREEAQSWAKQFRSEYPKEDGYAVKITETKE